MATLARSRKVPGAGSAAAADRIDPLAMTVAQAAKVLSAMGVGRVTEALIRRHVAAGAPTTADGRINLVHYAAWLNQRMGQGQPAAVRRGGDPGDEHGA